MNEILTVPDLFNLGGDDSYDAQEIFQGNPTGVANLNTVRYTWVPKLYQTMLGNFWVPQKTPLAQDKVNFSKLTVDEEEAFKSTISSLIFLDSYQVNNLPNIGRYVTCPGVKLLLTVQGFQEAVHTESYQYGLEAFYPSMTREEVYNRWRTNPLLVQRNKLIVDVAQEFVDCPTRENLIRVLIANYILEGLYFYQGFNFFDQLAYRGKIVEFSKLIDYIRVDEYTHVGLFVHIIRESGAYGLVDLIKDMFKQAVEAEIAWCHNTYGNRILGISEETTERYLKWLANDRLARIGVDKLYPGFDSNPYQHLDVKSRENFFESTVTKYNTADSVPGWDEF